ncbi:MAG: response regulator [Bacteroidales bacterium]
MLYKDNKRAEQENQEDQSCNWNGKNILLVEDDPVSMEYFKEVLAPTRVGILVAENGEQALKQFGGDVSPDLVLMDIQLPDISGLEVTREMKRVKPQIPIIAQTAHAMTEDREKCIRAGADEYISKPIAIDDLLVIINRFI